MAVASGGAGSFGHEIRSVAKQAHALECLRLAKGDIGLAREMLAFVTGDEVVVSGSVSAMDAGQLVREYLTPDQALG